MRFDDPLSANQERPARRPGPVHFHTHKPPLRERIRDAAALIVVVLIAFLILFLVCRGVGWCDEQTWTVTLIWNPSTEDDLKGYTIYRNGTQMGTMIPAGTEQADRVIGVGESVFYLTASDIWGNESGPSTNVTVTPDGVPPDEPVTGWQFRMLKIIKNPSP